jgi:hypothetical protein
MRYQEQIVKLTQKAVSDVIRAAEALPSDMREWSPAPEARSVMSQMQELAAASGWLLEIMQSRRMPEMSEDAKREIDDLVDQFHTFDDCVLGLKLGTAKLCDAIGAFPVEALEDEIFLPFGGGQSIRPKGAHPYACPSVWNRVETRASRLSLPAQTTN